MSLYIAKANTCLEEKSVKNHICLAFYMQGTKKKGKEENICWVILHQITNSDYYYQVELHHCHYMLIFCSWSNLDFTGNIL